MASASPAVEMPDLGQFTPLNRLTPEQTAVLLSASTIERVPPGRRLFSIGDPDRRLLFLLSGQLALVSPEKTTTMLKAATSAAEAAIADAQPRKATALARTSVTVLCVDRQLLAELLRQNGDDSACAAAPSEVPPPELNLGPIFASPLFARLPGHHLQVLMNRMSIVEVRAGEQIVRAGDDSACYHIIESGRFTVSHRRQRKARDTVIGELGPGEGFGESALIANQPHDVSVTALEDGRLLRFSKGEFLTLVVRPCVNWISRSDIGERQLRGDMLIDIRSPKAHARNKPADSINIPLGILRRCAQILDRQRRYIICGDNVKTCATAAFMLAQQGLEVLMLDESLRNTPSATQRPDRNPSGTTPTTAS